MKKWRVVTQKGYSEVMADGVSYNENHCTLFVKNGSIHETIAFFPSAAIDSIVSAENESNGTN